MTMTTIGQYLLDSLYDLGVEHIFGIPGDYVIHFNKQIEEHQIQFINATRENTAGYLADAYARIRGLGVVCITYGVGINITNAIAQAYVESSPVILISGAAGTQDAIKHPSLHHLINAPDLSGLDTTQLDIFRNITVAQAVLRHPHTAAEEIQRVLQACILHQKPVYIELPKDRIEHPIPSLPFTRSIQPKSHPDALKEALDDAKEALSKAHHPMIWAGHEVSRFRLSPTLVSLAEAHQIPIVSTLLGKTVIDEHHPLFLGVYQGKMSSQRVLKGTAECDLVIECGIIHSDVDTGMFTSSLEQQRRILAASCGVSIGHRRYENVYFADFLRGLTALPLKNFAGQVPPRSEVTFEPTEAKITAKKLFACLQTLLTDENIVVVDIGDALFGSPDLVLAQDSFLSNAYFGSLGFATPGAVGAALAAPQRRIVALVGDGAFQMTVNELATAVRYHLDPIIILLNNHGYGTERPILEGTYNDILNWKYTLLPQLFGGGKAILAKTEREFSHGLKQAMSERGQFFLIEADLGKNDFSEGMQRFVDMVKKPRTAG